MSNKEQHIIYLKKRGSLESLELYGIYFSSSEIVFLLKWYNWFEGLIKGEIDPINRNQKEFVDYLNSIKDKNELPNRHSQKYSKLTNNQKTLIRYFFVCKYKREILKFNILKNTDSIYFFSKNFLEFDSGQIKNYKFKGTYYDEKVKSKRSK